VPAPAPAANVVGNGHVGGLAAEEPQPASVARMHTVT
jgi:hypothetical protein